MTDAPDLEIDSFLESLPHREVKPGLERIRYLLEYLDYPSQSISGIRIGGTNGKGSVGALLRAVLNHNHTVGRFVSPPLRGFQDRIKVNGSRLSRQELHDYLARIRPAVGRLREQDRTPTLFEVATVVAALHFEETAVDLALLEVGLGGKYDATRAICDPVLAIITNVALEHEDLLGPTIQEIATEIAGIAEKNLPVVVGEDSERVTTSLRECISSAGAIFHPAYREVNLDLIGYDWNHWRYRIEDHPRSELVESELSLKLLGDYQQQNLSTALSGIYHLGEVRGSLSVAQIVEGVQNAWCPGRFDVVSQKPYIVLDGAHNPAAMESLATSLRYYRAMLSARSKIRVLMSVLEDKDFSKMVENLASQVDHFLIVELDHSRAKNLRQMENVLQTQSENYTAIKGSAEGFEKARTITQSEDLLCVCGSLYLVREAINRGYSSQA